MSVPMEEEDEDDDVWDMIRKPLKTVQDVLDYWDHRLEKVNTFKSSRFDSMLLLTILMTRYYMETMESDLIIMSTVICRSCLWIHHLESACVSGPGSSESTV